MAFCMWNWGNVILKISLHVSLYLGSVPGMFLPTWLKKDEAKADRAVWEPTTKKFACPSFLLKWPRSACYQPIGHGPGAVSWTGACGAQTGGGNTSVGHRRQRQALSAWEAQTYHPNVGFKEPVAGGGVGWAQKPWSPPCALRFQKHSEWKTSPFNLQDSKGDWGKDADQALRTRWARCGGLHSTQNCRYRQSKPSSLWWFLSVWYLSLITVVPNDRACPPR